MKLAGDKANNYFSNPDVNQTAILIYGSDNMRVALRRQEPVSYTHLTLPTILLV